MTPLLLSEFLAENSKDSPTLPERILSEIGFRLSLE
jgi:hypothetical protein